MFCYGVEHVLEDHVAAGVVQPCTLFLLLEKRKEREAHVDARHMAKHLLELDLLGVHEECVRDPGRGEFPCPLFFLPSFFVLHMLQHPRVHSCIAFISDIISESGNYSQ